MTFCAMPAAYGVGRLRGHAHVLAADRARGACGRSRGPCGRSASISTGSPACSARNCCAALIRFELKAPARPWSAVIRTSWMRCSGPLGQQRMRQPLVGRRRPRATLASSLRQHRRVGARGEHAVLRAAQLRRRDHLHGLGDLLRVLHRADAAPDVDQAGHRLTCAVSSCARRRSAP